MGSRVICNLRYKDTHGRTYPSTTKNGGFSPARTEPAVTPQKTPHELNMATQPIDEDIANYLLQHMSTASRSVVMILEDNKIAYSTGFRSLGFADDNISIGQLVSSATPKARQTIMSTSAIWRKFLNKFPKANTARCYLSVSMPFAIASQTKALRFTFSHMGEQRQIVFVKEGRPDIDSMPRILDPHAKCGYVYDGDDWKSEDWNLSTTEYKILHLSAQGQGAKTIADTLNISANTVNFHKKSILKKMGAGNALGALTFFAQKTEIPLEGTPIVMNGICFQF